MGMISAAEGMKIVRPFFNDLGESPGEFSGMLPCGEKLSWTCIFPCFILVSTSSTTPNLYYFVSASPGAISEGEEIDFRESVIYFA